MDPVSAAASVLAILQVSAKVSVLCFDYYEAVRDANADVTRLKSKIDGAQNIFEGIEKLLRQDDKKKAFEVTSKLGKAIVDCQTQLNDLSSKLESTRRKWDTSRFRRIGHGHLKWPIDGRAIDGQIRLLDQFQKQFDSSLQVDLSNLLRGVDEKLDWRDKALNLEKLPSVAGAVFNARDQEHNTECLPETRVDLLQQIKKWAQDPDSACVYWLNGLVGTGKSTIARTIARDFDKDDGNGKLGATFFFKRGEADRGSASKFFTTIAKQLAYNVPVLAPSIIQAVRKDPNISEKVLKDQFDNLIYNPLCEGLADSIPASALLIVVDALDECDDDKDVRAVIQYLLSAKNTTPFRLRVLITSRPDFAIRAGFLKAPSGSYQAYMLHDMPPEAAQHDMSVFIFDEFTKIRNDYNLPAEWPSDTEIEVLIKMTTPLFISAATICRHIGDKKGNSKTRLKAILALETSTASQLEKTYQPILNELLDPNDNAQSELSCRDFREVVGAIILLATPLSINSLAALLTLEVHEVETRLRLLHSVLNIPDDDDAPIRLFHLSFRDFLLEHIKPQAERRSLFWIEKEDGHRKLAVHCLELLSHTPVLKEDICNVRDPGTLRGEISSTLIKKALPPEVQYACQYWIHHLEQGRAVAAYHREILGFLHKRFLYWVEAMGHMGCLADTVVLINALRSNLDNTISDELSDFLYDAQRFILKTKTMIIEAPLQLYSSALIFSPEESVIRKAFQHIVPLWIRRLPRVQRTWGPLVQTIPSSDDTNNVEYHSLAFSQCSEWIRLAWI